MPVRPRTLLPISAGKTALPRPGSERTMLMDGMIIAGRYVRPDHAPVTGAAVHAVFLGDPPGNCGTVLDREQTFPSRPLVICNMPDERLPRFWIHRLRVSVRTLMILVLVLGGGLGWLAYLARQAQIQRVAVTAVRKVGGSVLYDWQFESGKVRVKPGTNIISDEVPRWPKWMVDRLGVDAFGFVTDVSFRPSAMSPSSDQIDEALAQVGNLRRLKHLTLVLTPVNDAGLACLEGLSNLESLMLRGRNDVTDAGVAHLARMTSLKGLYLENSQITDAGLASVSGLTGLETLNLARTQIGDGGLAHLDGLTRLEKLGLENTGVTDAGLVRFLRGRTMLKALYLSDTKIGDAALAALESMTNLGWLFLRNTRISGAGLVHLKGLTKLQSLDLYNTHVSDVGLSYLEGLTNLQHLNLDGTKVTDAGLPHLKGLTSLKELRLLDTGVTGTAVGELRKALPNLTIEHSVQPGSPLPPP
jgi:Leucine Rich repeats (2 copies)/Leucine Rich repeat